MFWWLWKLKKNRDKQITFCLQIEKKKNNRERQITFFLWIKWKQVTLLQKLVYGKIWDRNTLPEVFCKKGFLEI